MPTDAGIFEKVVEEQNPNLAAIFDGITNGIMEGVKEGVSDGLRKGFKEGLKDSLTGDFDNVGEFDFSELFKDVLEDTAKTSLREASRNIASRPAEIHMRTICSRIVIEVTSRNIVLTENDISQMEQIFLKAEQRMVKTLSDKLPDNPFIKEIADGIQTALQESMQKELESCRERLTQIRTNQ